MCIMYIYILIQVSLFIHSFLGFWIMFYVLHRILLVRIKGKWMQKKKGKWMQRENWK